MLNWIVLNRTDYLHKNGYDTMSILLSGVEQLWIQSFPSPISVAILRLKSPVCSTIYSYQEGE